MNNSDLKKQQLDLIKEKQALDQILSSDDGEIFLNYLAKLCLSDIGLAKKDAYEYAYSEGRRSVFLTLLQFGRRPLNKILDEIVKEEERI